MIEIFKAVTELVNSDFENLRRSDSFIRRMQTKVYYRSYIRCDNFDGKTCVDTYLAKFESCAEYNNWTAKDKAAHLKSALTGNAANLLQGNTRAIYAEVVGLLQRRYGNREQHEKFKLELKYRRRRPAEDIQSLAQEVESLVNRACPHAPVGMRETLSTDYFIDAQLLIVQNIICEAAAELSIE